MKNKSIGKQIIESLKQFSEDLENDDKHVWRLPHPHEPKEIGRVCIKCGAFKNFENLIPCVQEKR